MKRFRIFEDSAPFSLVISRASRETHAANSSLFTGDPDCAFGIGAWGNPALRTKRQSVRGKPLKSRRPYGRWNRNQGALVLCEKHDEHRTEKDNSAKIGFQRNVCSLGKSCQNCWRQWNEKAQKHAYQKKHRTGTAFALSSCS